jgi:hypothetical protein
MHQDRIIQKLQGTTGKAALCEKINLTGGQLGMLVSDTMHAVGVNHPASAVPVTANLATTVFSEDSRILFSHFMRVMWGASDLENVLNDDRTPFPLLLMCNGQGVGILCPAGYIAKGPIGGI